ncbi:MAG: VWA domain-containing protein [Planctomycetes bacterium]|nr:VWA domain-containing protein [Planctomycetota bacterium]MCW8134948.1 VWA domain-containing protein [Planctomycetota bacterium]
MPDLSRIELANPDALLGATVVGVMLVAVFAFPRRHSRGTVALAGAVRLLALGALLFALAGLVEVRDETRATQRAGVWRLLLDDTAPAAHATDFRETSLAFTNRVRNAFAEWTEPERVEIWGDYEQASRARDMVAALGVPTTAHWPDDRPERKPALLGIDAPRVLEPGEVAQLRVVINPPGATLKLYLDGAELPHDKGTAALQSDKPGRHVIEAVLLDESGAEVQRMGHVLRVSESPTLLLLGLQPGQTKRATEIARNWRTEEVALESFSAARLADDARPVSVVLTSVDALYRMGGTQVNALSQWVARGGGLFVTGDGAKFVAPEYMPAEARALLPVALQKEGKPPEPEDPPVEEEIVKAEVAKVSILFVLDRSLSMDAPVNKRPKAPTRWQVAVKGVAESLRYVQGGEERPSEALATRVGVLAFTLHRNWLEKPRVFLPFDRSHIQTRLERLRGDRDFDELGYNTDIYAAMEEAIEVMRAEPSAVKVIVMLSDGADRRANTVAGKRHSDLRERAIAQGINIYSIGLGSEFDGNEPDAVSARAVISDLATKREFARIPGSSEEAEKAHVIFVETVETAYQAYDNQKKKEEEDRKRRLEEQKARDLEPPKVDVLPGEFALQLTQPGAALFGADALPKPAPRAAWYARSNPRPEAAVALQLDADNTPPALAFHAWGAGRVGFWAVGNEPESLGEITGWADFPAILAASLRWLTPREVPDVRLVGEASPDGIVLLDPLDGAEYFLRADRDIPLALADGKLTGELPLGPAQVIERLGDEERAIGDVYLVPRVESQGAALLVADIPGAAAPPRAAVTLITRTPLHGAAVALCALFLILMPIERVIRRRS